VLAKITRQAGLDVCAEASRLYLNICHIYRVHSPWARQPVSSNTRRSLSHLCGMPLADAFLVVLAIANEEAPELWKFSRRYSLAIRAVLTEGCIAKHREKNVF